MRKDAPHTAERKAARAVVEGRVQGLHDALPIFF